MFYFQKDKGKNIYVFDDKEKNFIFMGHKAWKKMMENMVLSGDFVDYDGTIYKIKDKPTKFFMEYIPRVMQFEENIKAVENFEEVK